MFDQQYIQLIAKYLQGESSEEETQVLQKWLEASDDNRRLLEDLQRIWQPRPVAMPNFSSTTAWSNIQAQLFI